MPPTNWPEHVALLETRGLRPDFVLLQWGTNDVELDADYPCRFLHARTSALCRALGVTCRDLLPAFAAVPDRFTLSVSPFDSHPSVLANHLIADEVLASFAADWAATHR